MEKEPAPHNTEMLQKMLRQMRNVFLEEMAERLDPLDNLLLAMEKQGKASDEDFNDLYRGIHSIKGSGGTYGIHIISTICHQFEDQLNSVADHLSALPQAFFDHAFNYVELIRATADQARKGADSFPEIEKTLLELHDKTFAVERAILVVEGSRLSSKMYLQALTGLPVHTVTMENGYDALLRAMNEPFDILITSLEVPVLNGRALIGALRLSSSPNRNISTILLTSNTELEKQKKRASDANYVIVKNPAAMAHLHDTVSSILTILENASRNG